MDAYAGDIRGVWVRGSEPKELVLSDGSRLMLEPDAPGAGAMMWRRAGAQHREGQAVSMSEALELAGEEFTDYVEVRTRAEAEWLRTVAEWCETEARRLDHELTGAAR